MKRLGALSTLLAAAVCLVSEPASALTPVKTNNERGRLLREREGVWTLNIAYNRPKFITVRLGDKTIVYWYVLYEVTNYSGKDRSFVPRFELVTDTDKKYHDVVDPAAEAKVGRLEGAVPKLFNNLTISGTIKAVSPENTKIKKRGVALFRNVDPRTDNFTIYVTGLSNGYRKVKDPKTGKTVFRYKTLRLNFTMPGDEFYPDDSEIRFVSREWIYR